MARGFFFTLTMVVVLAFMLASVGMWSRVVEAREAAAPQKFKTVSFAQVLDELTDAKLSQFVKLSSYYAFYKLSNHTSKGPAGLPLPMPARGNDPDNKGTANVNASIYELMMNGSTRGAGAGGAQWSIANALVYSPDEMRYTLKYWNGTMGNATGQMGFNFSMGNISGFEVRQTSPWEVSVKLNASVTIVDKEGTFRMERNMSAVTNFTIDGLIDPLIAYESWLDNADPLNIPLRQVFRSSGAQTTADVQPYKIKDGTYGKGWSYGRLTDSNPPLTDIQANKYVPMNRYILVMDEPAKDAQHDYTSYLNSFGAVVVMNAPVETLTRIEAGTASSSCSSDKQVDPPPAPKTPCTNTRTSNCAFYIHRQTKCVDCLEWTSGTCDAESTTTNSDDACICDPGTPTPEQILASYISTHPNDNIEPRIYNSGTMMSVPYMAGSGEPTSAGNPPELPAGVGGGKYVLIDNEVDVTSSDAAKGKINRLDGTSASYHKIWDIEELRDMALSALYVEKPGEAPSYFQRFIGHDAVVGGSGFYGQYGIETFVVGMWAGGTEDVAGNAGKSRADHVFYSDTLGADARKIKGMPGCITKEKCMTESDSDVNKRSPFGYFRLDDNHIAGYGVVSIQCPKTGEKGAGCG